MYFRSADWEISTLANLTGARRWTRTADELPEEIDREYYATWIWKRGDLLWSPFIIWDVDSKEDIERALSNTQALVRYFLDIKVPEDALRIIFSTGKGFHVYLDSRIVDLQPSIILHRELRQFCTVLMPGTDPTLYDGGQRHVIGIPNSRHRRTGLYYCYLEVDQLFELTIEQMRRRAEVTWNLPAISDTMSVNSILRNKFLQAQAYAKSHSVKEGIPSPENLIRRMRVPNPILQGVREGGRNNAMFRAACSYRDKGLAYEETEIILNYANLRNVPNLLDEEVRKLLRQAYKEIP